MARGGTRKKKRKAPGAAHRWVLAPVLLAAAFLFSWPFVYGSEGHRRLDGAAHAMAALGTPLIGLDLTLPRQNVFTLVRDLARPVRVVDHGASRFTSLLGISQFFSRGAIRTVGDALAWLNIPLTARQAREVRLCRTLGDLREGEAIAVRPDPFQHGIASWYGPGFHGRMAASGEIYDMHGRTAAHRTLPMQSMVRVVAQRTGASTVVRINDRGPYVAGRIIDMSHRAKQLLGMGDLAAVYLERLDSTISEVDCRRVDF